MARINGLIARERLFEKDKRIGTLGVLCKKCF
jgi:hypothetical protein